MDAKVVVAIQVVGQEAGAALQGHGQSAQGQSLTLVLSQAGASGQEAAGEDSEQVQVHFHLAQVLLVLSSSSSAETDGVTEVVCGQAGHGGVQVDDAQGSAGLLVQHDVVQLGVVVSNAQGQLAFLQHIGQLSADLLVSQDEVDFGLDILCTAHDILSQNFFKDAEAVRGVVEVLDGLVQSFCGEACQLLLEGAKCDGALVEVLGSLGSLQANGAFDEVINAPVGILFHVQVGFTIQGGDQGQGTVGVVDLGVQMTGNSGDVLLQTFNVGESAVADLLQNVAAAGLGDHQVSNVNVATAVAFAGNNGSIQLELIQNIDEHSFHNDISP